MKKPKGYTKDDGFSADDAKAAYAEKYGVPVEEIVVLDCGAIWIVKCAE